MRVRKRKGRKPLITLREDEVMQACFDYVRKKGFNPDLVGYLKFSNLRHHVEFEVEAEKDVQSGRD